MSFWLGWLSWSAGVAESLVSSVDSNMPKSSVPSTSAPGAGEGFSWLAGSVSWELSVSAVVVVPLSDAVDVSFSGDETVDAGLVSLAGGSLAGVSGAGGSGAGGAGAGGSLAGASGAGASGAGTS